MPGKLPDGGYLSDKNWALNEVGRILPHKPNIHLKCGFVACCINLGSVTLFNTIATGR